MSTDAKAMKIAGLERASGVSRSTIHHYLNLGLLPPPRVEGPKLHRFGPEHLTRLAQIQSLREKGWSLPRIRDHLRRASARPRPRRRSNAGESDGTRAQILECATQLFAERGFHGVRLEDVARAMGIGKATIYRYFDGKQALFVGCVEQLRFTLVPKAMREAASGVSLAQQGRARAMAVLHHFPAYRSLNHLLGALAHGPDEALAQRARAERHAMITNAEPFLRKLMGANPVRSADPELLAYMVWGALIGAGERLTLDDKYTLDQVLAAYLEFTALGMSGTPRPR